MFYTGGRHTLKLMNCNWEQVCIISDTLTLSDRIVNALSAHGKLVHLILGVKAVTQTGITALIEIPQTLHATLHAYCTVSCSYVNRFCTYAREEICS